jgi:hypothetical protein
MKLRKKSGNPLLLHLTGGLGNQLFQITAALYSSKCKEIGIEWVLGRPRLNSLNQPQISCYELPKNITLLQRSNDSWLARKTLGYLLRSSVDPRGFERLKSFHRAAVYLGSFVLLTKSGSFRKITTGDNLGFYPLRVDDKDRYLVGYFQTYRYLEDQFVRDFLQNLKVKNFEQYTHFKELAVSEEPLVVHVRLTDYRTEDNFGIPDKSYYHNAILELWKTGLYKRIWLFSDEPRNALERVPRELLANVRVFDDIENCTAKTLEVMRLGRGYVIANSSFSWWGAQLSKSDNPVVVVPDPWFSNLNEPSHLIPINWIRRKAGTGLIEP